jgi:hypothetical protein
LNPSAQPASRRRIHNPVPRGRLRADAPAAARTRAGRDELAILLSRLPGQLEASTAAARALFDATGQRQILLDRLPAVTAPTLVIWGGCDYVLPAHQAQSAVGLLPHGRLALLPDCGHLPHVEHPDRFAAVSPPRSGRRGDRRQVAGPWTWPLRAWVAGLHAPFVTDFTGFDRPWRLLADLVPTYGSASSPSAPDTSPSATPPATAELGRR